MSSSQSGGFTGGLPLKGFLETSFLDWPGRVAAILFLGGCNFRCPYCHNPELVESSGRAASLSWPHVRKQLMDMRNWLDGVVVTGGEPSLSPGLSGLLEDLKSLGFAVRLDTNGTNPESIADLFNRGLVDHLALDVKATLNETAYQRAVGRPGWVSAVKSSLELTIYRKIPHTLRTTVVPGLHDRETLLLMARELGAHPNWILQNFRPGRLLNPRYDTLTAMPEEQFAALTNLVHIEHEAHLKR